MFMKYNLLQRNKTMRLLLAAVSLLMVVLFLTSFALTGIHDVTVTVDGMQQASFLSLSDDVTHLLSKSDITVDDDDGCSVETNGNKITVKIERAFLVNIVYGDVTLKVMTASKTVEQLLEDEGIPFDATDRVSPAYQSIVKAGDIIKVTLGCERVVTETQEISYKTIKKNSADLQLGKTKIEQEGKNGTRQLIYKIRYENGKQVKKTEIESKIVESAVDRICVVGTKQTAATFTASENATAPEQYAKVISVNATAYSYECDGGQITCLGKKPYRGTVAVDPSVIPLGTKMYIASPDGKYVYGYCVAGDTGGAIKGNRVDLFMPTKSECNTFGRRTMNVYILN